MQVYGYDHRKLLRMLASLRSSTIVCRNVLPAHTPCTRQRTPVRSTTTHTRLQESIHFVKLGCRCQPQDSSFAREDSLKSHPKLVQKHLTAAWWVVAKASLRHTPVSSPRFESIAAIFTGTALLTTYRAKRLTRYEEHKGLFDADGQVHAEDMCRTMLH